MRKLLLLLVLAGCSHQYLNVDREYVDRGSLASTFVGSPDPAQKNPPDGVRLWMHYMLPPMIFEKDSILTLHVIYKNFEEEKISYPVPRATGWAMFPLLDDEFKRTGGLLTWRADIEAPSGKILATWKHQMWFQIIPRD
ncbi:MAG: hypothetical protein MRY21_01785 [Simkaniaceae bacterium]|nr:hypothetical protein [Simkaniaceae bacterium]